MRGDGLLVGELAERAGVSRKALRIYEASNILAPARRTPSGYRFATATRSCCCRVYDRAALDVVTFVKRAQRLGFRLEEIRQIVAIRRAGRIPCAHVKALVRRKLADLEMVRRGLRGLLRSWRSPGMRDSAICPHIERGTSSTRGRERHGRQEDVAVPVVRHVPRGGDRGR
jgi:DNA-binding transcriptional MerR regulator